MNELLLVALIVPVLAFVLVARWRATKVSCAHCGRVAQLTTVAGWPVCRRCAIEWLRLKGELK